MQQNSIMGNNSDRSVFFTKTHAEREADFQVRKREARAKLLATFAELNHECVHPLNPNYWTEDKGNDALIAWARSMELMTKRDWTVWFGF